MTETSLLDGTTLTDRVVLLGVADLAGRDETPTHAGQVVKTCNDALDGADVETVGRLSEGEVAPTLSELEAEGALDGYREDASPSGKGRPRYELAADREAVLGDLATDDRVATLVERVR
jgi:DNA-binding PadR family transcriptional regulator